MYGYIYKTTCLINRKVYIGQKMGTFNSGYTGSGKLIKRAINKYGKNNFKVKFIKYKDSKKLADSLEICLIKKYNCRSPNGYNIAEGGQGGALFRGYKHTQESKHKQYLGQLRRRERDGYINSPEAREKCSKAQRNKSKKHPDYCKCPWCNDHIGKNNPMFGVHRFGKDAPMWNKHHTEKTKRKIALGHLGIKTGPRPLWVREKISRTKRGIK